MSESSTKAPVSAFTLFNKSKELVQKNLNLFLLLYLVPLVFTILDYARTDRGDRSDQVLSNSNAFTNFPTAGIAAIVGLGIVFVVAGIIIGALYQAMLTSLEYEASLNRVATLSKIWQMAKKYVVRLFFFGILYGIAIALGLVLLIVPGLIVLRRYFLASYAIIDKDMSISDAMKYSAAISKPYAGSVWGVIGVMLLIAMTGIVPVLGGLISLVLGMLYSVAPALRYHELKKLHG